MNKTSRYILIGVGSFIGILLIIVLIRVLIKGIPFADGIRNWLWLQYLLSKVFPLLYSL